MTHRYGGLCAVFGSLQDIGLNLFVAVSEYLIESVSFGLGVNGNLMIGNSQILKFDQIRIKPLTVRL